MVRGGIGTWKVGMDLLAVIIQVKPVQASQLMRPRVWMLLSVNPMMAAMTTNTAVQAPCVDTAFRAMEEPSMPDPATNVQSA